MELHRIFGRAHIDDRLVNELIGMARGIAADGMINQSEAEYLYTWLIANSTLTANPLVATLLQRIHEMLSDGKLDSEEATELMDTIQQFTGERVETGEILKSTTLPLDKPAPAITIPNKRFCFTGTFAFGSRNDCEAAVAKLGGIPGTLTKGTDYLVIGVYATDSWAHSSYGRKIEKAVDLRNEGKPIAIISEEHWINYL